MKLNADDIENADKFRVLHVVTSLDFGGVERHVEILAANQDSSRWELHFCALGRGGAVEKRLSALGAHVTCLGQETRIPSLKTMATLYKLIRRLKPQVVHAHGAEANFHGLIAAWLAGVPVRIGEEIGIPAHGKRAKIAFRQIYRFAHRVIGVSDAVRCWLVENGEVPAEKVVCIYNPVVLKSPKNEAPDPDKVFRIGFVGRLEKVKNPLALVEAVALLRKRDVPAELWLVGDGSQRRALEQSIKTAALEEIVHLYGYQDEPVDYICRCNVFVQPSLSEGFSIALVEAMGCAVPVLATSVGGAPNIITHGETGWLMERPDADALADALMEAWNHRYHLTDIGDAGRRAVQNCFEPPIYIEKLDALYNSLALA